MRTRSSGVSFPGWSALRWECAPCRRRAAAPRCRNARTVRSLQSHDIRQRHGQHRDIHRGVVVYWSNSLSCSSGTSPGMPPCIATDSDRTIALGLHERHRAVVAHFGLQPAQRLRLFAQREAERRGGQAARACGASLHPSSPPSRADRVRRICRASVVSITDTREPCQHSSRNPSKSSRVTASWNSRR